MASETRLVMLEDCNFKVTWECESCKEIFKDTKKTLSMTHCPKCKSKITDFIGYEEEDE